MKITVKTTGSFLVHDVFGGQTISPGEEKSVHLTEYIKHALSEGRLEEVSDKKAAKEEAEPVADKDKGKSNGPTSGTASKK
ncbi:hypothetical protein [Sphingopyxis flava]|uniref:Uncharacterized protein n=1 Tax=Sphingopyxis flava TaxID=1507287 RepID=A0A1T5CSQ1_9SPHN|nr:hypothetical protein [Sphingopyxis flava]SKB62363.1 hypothetical protein SAMN06295937_101173 [Sphingopyxis flava]